MYCQIIRVGGRQCNEKVTHRCIDTVDCNHEDEMLTCTDHAVDLMVERDWSIEELSQLEIELLNC